MDFSDRVRARMSAVGLSAFDLSQLVGVSKSAVSHWTSGANQTSGKRLIALAKALECDVAWLAMGEGHPTGLTSKSTYAPVSFAAEAKERTTALVLEMLKTHAGKSLNSAAKQRIAKAVAESLETRFDQVAEKSVGSPSLRKAGEGELCIPHFDFHSIEGAQLPTDYSEAVRSITVSEAYLQAQGVRYSNAEQLAVVTCWDKGMEGTLREGDAVIVDCGVEAFTDDGVYLVSWAEHTFIRRLQLAGKGKVELIADNSKHKARVVGAGDVVVHGRVLIGLGMQKL
ncbi:S24 family peptidase [Pseudomonas solani]|uniref:S24 family peptidase n=1 Tax=Pseudomonas solani TaxID=2731552 RepID=A0AAU7Y0D1_9PSED